MRTALAICYILSWCCLSNTALRNASAADASKAASQSGATGGQAILSQLHKQPSFASALDLVRSGDVQAITQGLSKPGRRALVAWALARHPVPAVRKTLESLLESQDQVTAYHAAFALGALGDARSVPVLAGQIPDNPDDFWELAQQTKAGYRGVYHRIRGGKPRTIFATPNQHNLRVTYASVEALGLIGGNAARQVLESALASPQYLVRYGAVRGLAQIGDSTRRQLQRVARTDKTFLVRTAAARALRRFDRGNREMKPPSLDRLAKVPAIAFIKTRYRSDANFGFRDSYFFPKTPWFAAGENIYSLTPPRPGGKLRNLTNLKEGAVQGLEVSPDGRRLLFSMRKDRKRDSFHIYEMNVDGTDLRQITFGACHDVDPCYLGDGRIVFCSDRDGTHEFYHQERVRVLYIVNAGGDHLRQLTFNPNQDYEPLALHDGRIAFSSYRFYGQDGSGGVFYPKGGGGIARIESQLRTVMPDGTGNRVLYGTHRGSFFVPVRAMPDSDQSQAPQLSRNRDHIGVSISHHRQLSPNRLICMSPAGLTIVDLAQHPLDCELPLFPEVVNLAGGEEVYIHNHDDLNPVGRYTAPYPIDRRTVLLSYAPFFKRGPYDYGLYLFDLETRRQSLIYDDPEYAEVGVVPLAPSYLPRYIRGTTKEPPSEPDSATSPVAPAETGEIVILSVFNSDLPFDRRAVKYLRVSTAEQLGNAMNANGAFRSRIVGTVPTEADGSVRITVPANTPLHFQLLDIDEKPLVHETAFNSVAVGEVLSCVGCHEPKGEAPRRTAPPLALKHPPHEALLKRNDLIYMGQPWQTYSVMRRE